jgi:GAF domain-containing protein
MLITPPPTNVRHDFQNDLEAVAALPVIGTILEVVCRTTGLRFAAVARVTEDRWICCASQDDLQFGLVPGAELKVESTICNEIRAHGREVAIDHVAEETAWRHHHTPALYGFQSYISVPIMLADGNFFGTLCAIDPHPNTLNNPSVLGMFRLFAQLIAHELDNHARLEQMERENRALREAFDAGLGHDMKNTLAAMLAGTRLLSRTPLNERAQLIVAEMEISARRLSQQVTDAMSPGTLPPAS